MYSIQKLETLVKTNLYQFKSEIRQIWGEPSKLFSNGNIWVYKKRRLAIFRDEITFVFENNKVVDITVTESLFGIEYRNIWFYEGSIPEYKTQNFF